MYFKFRFVLPFVLLALVNNFLIAQTEQVTKVYKISGIGKGGKYTESKCEVVVRSKELTPEQLDAQQNACNLRYANFEYSWQSQPSRIYDCGGFVFYKLFGIGPYWIDAKEFAQAILYPFGEQVRPPAGLGALGWGDVKENDIVFYPQGHVARITAVENDFGITKGFWIESKADMEAVYLHYVGYSEREDDPLLSTYGEELKSFNMGKRYFHIYHIPDFKSLKVEEIIETDLNKFSGEWYFKDSWGSGYYIWTFNVRGNSGSEMSGNVKLTSTDRQDNFVLFDIIVQADGSIEGTWEGDYVNENAVSHPKRGHRVGKFYAKINPGQSASEDVILVNCIESDKSQIHPGKDWGWSSASRQMK
ncbi:MAG: lipocalin-like domain-containing protein [Ignavibacteria bacterium]|nr:lipocalin-like domain-containing protein [Ignavibacteria bacterium]